MSNDLLRIVNVNLIPCGVDYFYTSFGEWTFNSPNVMRHNVVGLVPGKEQRFKFKSFVVFGQREFYESLHILGNSGQLNSSAAMAIRQGTQVASERSNKIDVC